MEPFQDKTKQSPRINRFIPEFSHKVFFRVGVISVLSLALLFGILQQTKLLVENRIILTHQTYERKKVVNELTWWEHVSQQYQGYRDVYFQMSVLLYRLGETQKANESLAKVLELDPNFQEARVLQEKLAL